MKLDFDTIEFWNNLNRTDKRKLTVQMFALFPRVLGRHGDKYNKLSFWLIKEKMIINHHIRDCFTAGPKVNRTINGKIYRIPSVLERLEEYFKEIKEYLENPKNINEIRREWGKSEINMALTLEYWGKCVIREIKQYFEDTSFPARKYFDTLNK